MKKVAILTSVLLISCLTKAQNDVDALRYSRLDFGGTARFNSMAGAFGALGGDFSSLSTNPAGIAIYRKSELSFSPSLYHSGTSSNFMGTNSVNDKYNFNFGNAGYVYAGHVDDKDNSSDWRGFAMGFGYNRMANFNNSITVQGTNKTGSMIDTWVNDANSHGADTASFDQFGTLMAYQAGLIGHSSPNQYFGIIGPPYGEMQSKTITTTGAVGETVFSIGGNFRDKLYIGGTLGMPRIRFSEESDYTETVANDTTYLLKSFTYHSSLQTDGLGINGKFGVIVKPTAWLRLGAAVHSPTRYHMTDTYSNTLDAEYNMAGGSYKYNSPNGSYDYKLITPGREIVSAAFLYKNLGLLSVDYEIVNYASAKLSAADYAFTTENTDIRQKYTTAGNLRVGAEVRVAPFSFRGGFALYGSPYKNDVNSGGQKQSYTCGIGYHGNGFFVDVAYIYSVLKEDYYMYDPQFVPPAKNTTTVSTVMFTVGIKY